MRLTVLGCYGPYPKAHGACSGYLLETSDTKILIDCGNGTLSRLFIYCNDLTHLDAIFISHLHPDHMSDLMVLRYAIAIRKMLGKLDRSIPVYLPSSPKEDFERIQYEDAFIRKVIQENDEVMIQDIKVTFKRTDHPVECYAIAFEKSGKKFVYSGDTRYFDGLVDFVKDSEFFLCEAGVLEKDRNENTPHLSAKQAVEIASRAGIRRIVLTHFLPDIRPNDILEEASDLFPHILEMAEEGKVYHI